MNEFETIKLEKTTIESTYNKRILVIPSTRWESRKCHRNEFSSKFENRSDIRNVVEIENNWVKFEIIRNTKLSVSDYERTTGLAFQYNPSTFFVGTKATWSEAKLPANVKANFESADGSFYFYTSEGVYRASNHWGIVASCNWNITTTATIQDCFHGAAKVDNPETVVGFCKWSDFSNNK